MMTYQSCASVLSEIRDKDFTRRLHLVSCMDGIADRYMNGKILTVLLPSFESTNVGNLTTLDNLLLQSLFKKELSISILKVNNKIPQVVKLLWRDDFYIIHIRSVKELTNGLVLRNIDSWNPHANFIVISTNHFKDSKKVIGNLTQQMWKEKSLNVIFIFPKKHSNIFDVVTWFPYSDGHCADNFSKTKIINQCINGSLSTAEELFAEKIPLSLNQCKVKVRTVNWPPYVIFPEDHLGEQKSGINFTEGFEIILLNQIASIANFSINYSLSLDMLDWGALDFKGNTVGLFKTLLSEEVDLGISALAATPIRYKLLDPSEPYTFEFLTWCVPIARFKPEWMTLFQAFSWRTWLLILLAYITVSSTMYIIINFNRVFNINTSDTQHCEVSYSFMNMFSILFQVPIFRGPHTFPTRVVFILWTLSCLNFVALYQSTLIKFMLQPALEKQITNLEDLVEHDMRLGSFYIWRLYFNITNNDNPVEEKMKSKWLDCHDIELCLNDVAYWRNYSIAIPRLFISYSASKYVDKHKRPLIYLFKHNHISYPVQLYAYRGFPFIHRINQIIRSIKQSGILSKWYHELKKPKMMKKKIGNENPEEDYNDGTEHVLNIIDMQGAFFLYSLGVVIAFFVFLSEVILFRVNFK